jgi:hypothetical protein
MNHPLLASMLLTLLATTALAQEGINLSWDDCGSYGASLKQFACDTNQGNEVLVISFKLAVPLQDFVGPAALIDIRSVATLPDWWRFSNPPQVVGCRDTFGLHLDTEGGSCLPALSNPFVGGLAAPIDNTTQSTRLGAAAGQEPPAPLLAGTEYVALRLLLAHHRSTGSGACAGCSEPVCIVLNELILGGDQSEVRLTMPLERNYVTWQGTIPTCPGGTPALRATWGAIKSLYHRY